MTELSTDLVNKLEPFLQTSHADILRENKTGNTFDSLLTTVAQQARNTISTVTTTRETLTAYADRLTQAQIDEKQAKIATNINKATELLPVVTAVQDYITANYPGLESKYLQDFSVSIELLREFVSKNQPT